LRLLLCSVMMKIHLADLRPGQTVDEWYNLMPVNLTTKSDMGTLRVSIRYLHEVIMPAKEYSSLKEVVQFTNYNLLITVLLCCYIMCF